MARGKAMQGASGVRRSFSGSSERGVMTFWPMCWSMTSQAAVRKGGVVIIKYYYEIMTVTARIGL